MKLFEAVKEAVTARSAAEYYGIKVGRNGMAVCPLPDREEYQALTREISAEKTEVIDNDICQICFLSLAVSY